VAPPATGTAGSSTSAAGAPASSGGGASGLGGGGQSGSGAGGSVAMPVAGTTPPAPDGGTEPAPDAGGTMEPMQPGAECGGDDGSDFALVGWAAQAGGTTGGKGGTAVTVSTGSALLQALANKNAGTPLTIRVMGTITQGNTGAEKIDVKEVQDVSIIGLGAGAELDGIGIKIVRASNVVIRNLKIHDVAIGDKDGISIEGPADHIWIDHCELYSVYPDVDKDFYDGLIDVKAEAEYITYSWNNLHDSWKTMLVGSSEDDTFDRKLTIHHNVFRNCNSRMPLFRGGQGHVFNNFYTGVADTGINSRLGACLLIEANVFENSKNPWVSAFSDELGGGELRCNMTSADTTFAYADDVRELPTCDTTVPYDYAAVLNHPSNVEAVVTAGAGVGKLPNPEQF
jgi:pectate lyase